MARRYGMTKKDKRTVKKAIAAREKVLDVPVSMIVAKAKNKRKGK